MKRLRKLAKSVAGVMAFVMVFSVVFSNELTAQAATKSKEIFSGGADESYESNDASWLMNADDSDVVKIVYSCTDDTHAGWGVLGWGATVDDVWKDGPGLSASETDATAKVTAKVTIKDLKKTLGIKDGSNVSFIKLGAWNGGKIESLSISGAGAASTDSSSSSTATEEVVIQAPPELTGDYLYLVDSLDTITIWPDLYLQYWVPGQTITLRVTMESNGSFGGCFGTCVNKWAWQMEQFASDTGNTITVEWGLTPLMNNIQLQFWWMSGTQIGVKSIEVIKGFDPTVYPKTEEAPSAPETPNEGHVGNANASYSGYVDMADSTWWTERELTLSELIGNVDPATVSSIVFNGETSFTIGYKPTAGDWAQPTGALGYTLTDVNLTDYMLKLCLSKGDGQSYRFTWDVYTNGATPDVGGGSTEDTPSNVKTATHTFDKTENFKVNLNDYFPDLQVGDKVKLTVDTSSTGYYGGGLGANDASGEAPNYWTQSGFSNEGGTSTSITITVLNDSSAGNNVEVQMWWLESGKTVDSTLRMEVVE